MVSRHITKFGRSTKEWMLPPRLCPLMKSVRMGFCGVTHCGAGYYVERQNDPTCLLVFCFAGHGRVWVGGKWKKCGPGDIYWMPPLAAYKMEPLGGQHWDFSWVFYECQPGDAFVRNAPAEPALIHGEVWLPYHALEGLYHEYMGARDEAAMETWIQALHTQVLRFLAGGGQRADPLAAVWRAVDQQPANPWCLDELAAVHGSNIETVRQLSLRHTGRSPMAQVAYLRVHRARTYLKDTAMKIEEVAYRVGFQRASALRKAFMRHIGRTPGRDRRGEKAAPAPAPALQLRKNQPRRGPKVGVPAARRKPRAKGADQPL